MPRLSHGDTFVDVGANIGYDSILASRLVGAAGRVVSIEASPEFHRKVLHQARLNRAGNVRAINAAVSDRRRPLTFVLASSHNMGENSAVPYDGPAESTFTIDAAPLPELLGSDELANARVIKIDVEGAEGGVIRGLAPALGKLRPDAEIAIEVTPERMAKLGDSIEELLETMEGSGFHAYRIVNDYSAESYPPALHRAPSVPTRWRQPLIGENDLVFSRIDADALT
ncbi:FkbM family methyltransferase [Streptacidiphilus sp. 4-A2]|nr:FkbM family methyltransferase [Streptacidiphilus sp. 4-A2]